MNPKYQPVLQYIKKYWVQVLAVNNKPTERLLGDLSMRLGNIHLPHPMISPNDKHFAHTQFYWDSYFTILGLASDNQLELAKGMVDNLLFLFPKFGLMPARNTWTSLGRSQPPFLTRMVYEVYNSGGADKIWLDKVMNIALREYETVWRKNQRYIPSSGLSLYRPKYLSHQLTVYESGWDTSTRFRPTTKRIIPVDLNCLLYQYEADFAAWRKLNNDPVGESHWQTAMKKRATAINQSFWDEKTGFYYDNIGGKLGSLKTLAGFFPMWCGAASKSQAEQCLKQLEVFEQNGGLSTTERLPWRSRQWDYPNGWAPLNYIVYEALIRYGFKTEAKRIAGKWLDLNAAVFEETGKLWEKYDVVNSNIGLRGGYPTQSGFAWTNGVFLKLSKELNYKV